MKIAIVAATDKCNFQLLKLWCHHYQESQSTLEPVLVYENIKQEILDWWPYEKIKSKINFKVNSFSSGKYDLNYLNNEISKFFYVDTLKMSCFRQVGECIVTDYDTIIKKKIDKDNIPYCNFGAVMHQRCANFFTKNMLEPLLTRYDEFDFVPLINLGVLIFRQDYLDLYLEYAKKYFSTIHREVAPECYGQDIGSLVFRLSNGTCIQPEWNWYYDCSVSNNQVIIEHYWSGKAKEKLNKLIEEKNIK